MMKFVMVGRRLPDTFIL